MERALVSWVVARGSNRVSEVDANLADSIYFEKKKKAELCTFSIGTTRDKNEPRSAVGFTDFTTGAMSGGVWSTARPGPKPIERRIGDFST